MFQSLACAINTTNLGSIIRNMSQTSETINGKWLVLFEQCWWMGVVFFSSERLARSAWITRRTAFGKMGKGFATYREASTTAGFPGSTGRTGCSRCPWQDWMPSRRRFTSEHAHCWGLSPCSFVLWPWPAATPTKELWFLFVASQKSKFHNFIYVICLRKYLSIY